MVKLRLPLPNFQFRCDVSPDLRPLTTLNVQFAPSFRLCQTNPVIIFLRKLSPLFFESNTIENQSIRSFLYVSSWQSLPISNNKLEHTQRRSHAKPNALADRIGTQTVRNTRKKNKNEYFSIKTSRNERKKRELMNWRRRRKRLSRWLIIN